MPITDDTFFKSRDTFLNDMLAQLQVAVPDAYVGEDAMQRILLAIDAGQFETLSLAMQLLVEDMYIRTASMTALRLHGMDYNLPVHEGTKSFGQLTFTGDGGIYIPLGTRALYDPGAGIDPTFFETITDGNIPNPGVPIAPVAAVGASTGLTGDYEYAVTFVTAEGETLQSIDSNIVSVSNQKVNLSAIPLGGPGTINRRIYRQKGGTGSYFRVATITDNTTTTLTGENMSDGTAATQPTAPVFDNAHALTLNAQSMLVGTENNVLPGTITALSGASGSITGVFNQAAFSGGTDIEDTENYRRRLLERIREPETGSPADLKVWAEDVPGVDTATVFANDNLGTATPGHVTVRIAGPDGTTPNAATIQAVLDEITSRDMANVTIHVGTFTAVPTNVTVDVTTDSTFTTGDVTPAAQQAIINYINDLAVGGTLYLAGIVDAVFGLPGIIDAVVTTPGSNQTTAATSKRTPGTITIT